MEFPKEYKNKAGVYKIQNKKNGKFYIGSSMEMYGRFRCHRSTLRNNSHINIVLQRAWNKYEEENFEFVVLHTVPRNLKVLRALEQEYLDKLNPEYNLTREVEKPLSTKITPRSESHRKNHSKAMRSSKRVQSEQYKKEQSEKVKAVWEDEEHREKMMKIFGSDETRKRHADSTKRMMSNPEMVERIKKTWKKNFFANGKKIGIRSVEMLIEMRELYGSGVKMRDLAARFDVHYETVRSAVKKNKYDWMLDGV